MGMLMALCSLRAVSTVLSRVHCCRFLLLSQQQMLEGHSPESEVGRNRGRGTRHCVVVTDCGSWGRHEATVLLVIDSSPWFMKYMCQLGTVRRGRKKWLGRGRRPWSKAEKPSGERMVQNAFRRLVAILRNRRNKLLVQITCTYRQITWAEHAGFWNRL